jgi:hypothetical protein
MAEFGFNFLVITPATANHQTEYTLPPWIVELLEKFEYLKNLITVISQQNCTNCY